MRRARPRVSTSMGAPIETSTVVANPEAPPRRRRRRLGWIALQLALGTVAGIGVAEYVFWHRDDGAFPHVNFYVPDDALGVRLEPGAEMRFRFRDNPTHDIRVNARGFRGTDWSAPPQGAAPGAGEIVVVGDSQVFGLGVADDETFSARLAALTGRPVINAGVPTYGPAEYLATTRELLEERAPQTVVYVLNFVNDGFELTRPNRERHAVWDGWAVRIEHAPADTFAFPGRRWLYRNSHAFYALRRWWNDIELDTEGETAPVPEPDLGLPSEGTWRDLVTEGEQSHAVASEQRSTAETELAARRRALAELVERRAEIEKSYNDKVLELDDDWDYIQHEIARSNPGDIVDDGAAEESRSVLVTAAMLRRAVVERDRRAKQIVERDRKHGAPLGEIIEQRSTLARNEAELRRALAGAAIEEPPTPSVFAEHLTELKALCDAHGAELVVVALPIDVQVSQDEWAKYGAEPIDMTPSLALLDDTVADARALGAIGVQPTAALAAAEPGAFLDGDIHMTAKGHAALAQAIVDGMVAPPPLQHPRSGLPEGRTAVPPPRAWAVAAEVTVRGSTDAGCRTQIVDGWFKVTCNRRSKKRGRPTGITVRYGGGLESMQMVTGDAAVLLMPLHGNSGMQARFDWERSSLDLTVSWPAGADGKPRFFAAFTPATDIEGAPVVADPRAEKLCTCHEETTHERTVTQRGDLFELSCAELYGGISDDCLAAFPEDCARLLACVRGEPLAAPSCDGDETLIAAVNVCAKVCDADHPCAAGDCVPYNDGGVCHR